MTNRSRTTKEARKLYGTKAQGTSHQTVMNLLHERGLDGTIAQLEAWGMRPIATGVAIEEGPG